MRLSKYKSSLYRLKAMGFVKVFSDNLADAVGVMPSQVRKDFSIFGISGNKRGGYQIDALIEQLNRILGKDQEQKAVVVGIGHLGSALMKYQGFEKDGIKLIAGFDIDPDKFAKGVDVPILPLDELKDFVRSNNIRVGIIAVPEIAAQQAADLMMTAGIKGILNFAPIRLRASEQVVINNPVRLSIRPATR
jgi:redox-sensing transcriptional repressor